MCGACGTAAVTSAEDLLAGAGPAQRAARAAAAGRLLTGRPVRVSTWRGGYLVTAATGRARVAADLDQLWDAAGLPRAAPGRACARAGWAWSARPAGWDLQAAVVWLSAAVRRGDVIGSALPDGPTDRIGVRAPDPGRALAGLLAFASGADPACPPAPPSVASDASGRNGA
ncbi:hypothetical protein [Blastococcus sp. VKM Ac-2987]|uniref:hypothetical protein n=1 Tax=Blastococcus sp. VKM Ac-2987 TaxID=3004141 RepID=UPI0022ABBD15|nr:hypothetical protein [Blastococcus sp. VKM Ac-2987]MCZ2860549.1 hypothetical protein [Blastococcus sp. VKM Ac-2987]